jgi:hypothetical protein
MLAQFSNKVKSYDNHNEGGNLSCIPKDCHEMMSDYNCSCLKALTNRTCNEISDPIIPIVLWSISAIILLLLFLELFIIRWVSIWTQTQSIK